MSDRIVAHYRIETAAEVQKAAEVMAGEQSSGTFVAIPGETPELTARAGARVERIEMLESVAEPSLPGARAVPGKPYQRANVTLSWPLDNMGPSLPNLVATVAGNLFELQQFSGLRLLDIELPAPFFSAYAGPQFGIAGTRELSGVTEGPLIGTIVKPSVGFGPDETAALVQTLCEAGIDFVKDDELQANGPHCPFPERVDAVTKVVNDHAERTGKKVMFAFNVTGDLAAGVPDGLVQAVELGHPAPEQHQPRPGGGAGKRGRAPQAAVGSGHQHRPAGERQLRRAHALPVSATILASSPDSCSSRVMSQPPISSPLMKSCGNVGQFE